MNGPNPTAAMQALASFVRQRLSDVSGTLAPLWSRRDPAGLPATADTQQAVAAARQVALVIVGAAAPFAPTHQARLRLLRQMHASGLLSERETEQAVTVLGAPH